MMMDGDGMGQWAGGRASGSGRSGVALSLFIGLGAVGCEVLLEARRRVAALYGSPQRAATLRWLAIDIEGAPAGANSLPEPPGVALLASEMLRLKASFGALAEHDASPALGSAAGESWWRESAPQGSACGRALDEWASGGVGDGVKGGVRVRGRLALLGGWPLVEASVRDSVRQACLAETIAQAREALGPVDETQLNVYVVSSLGEGLGGGLCDLAYGLRQMLRQSLGGVSQNVNLIGLALLPLFSATEHELANTHAALAELNHWSDRDTVFRARGPGGIEVGPDSEAPFDFCYLLSERNREGIAIDGETLAQMAAQWLALDITPDFASARNNDRPLLRRALMAGDEWGAPTCYASAGVAGLKFPRDLLEQACAHRLAREAWSNAMRPRSSPEEARLAAQAAEWLRQAGLDAASCLYPSALPEAQKALDEQWREAGRRAVELPNSQLGAFADEALRSIEGGSTEGSSGSRQEESQIQSLLEKGLESVINDAEGRHAAALRILHHAREGAAAVVRALDDAIAASAEREEESQARWRVARAALEGLQQRAKLGWLARGAREKRRQEIESAFQCAAAWGSERLRRQALQAERRAATAFAPLANRMERDVHRFGALVEESFEWFQKQQDRCEASEPGAGERLVLHPSDPPTLKAAAALHFEVLAGLHSAAEVWEAALRGQSNPTSQASQSEAQGLFRRVLSGGGEALRQAVQRESLGHSRRYFAGFDALELWTRMFPDSEAAASGIQKLLARSAPYFPLTAGAVVPGYNEAQATVQRRAAFFNARDVARRNESQENFASALSRCGFVGEAAGEGAGARDALLPMSDRTQVVFWSEAGGFPLRAAGRALEPYATAYQKQLKSSAALHSREDIALWLPVEPPSPQTLRRAWARFIVLLACGDITVQPPGPAATLAGTGSNGNSSGRSFVLQGKASPASAPLKLIDQAPPLLHMAIPEDAPFPPAMREAVLRLAAHEEQAEALVSQHRHALGAPQLGRKLVSYLEALPSDAPWRHHAGDVLASFINAELGGVIAPAGPRPSEPSVELLQKQLAVLNEVLRDPARSDMHEAARHRRQEVLLALKQRAAARVAPDASLDLDPEARLNRLLEEA